MCYCKWLLCQQMFYKINAEIESHSSLIVIQYRWIYFAEKSLLSLNCDISFEKATKVFMARDTARRCFPVDFMLCVRVLVIQYRMTLFLQSENCCDWIHSGSDNTNRIFMIMGKWFVAFTAPWFHYVCIPMQSYSYPYIHVVARHYSPSVLKTCAPLYLQD